MKLNFMEEVLLILYFEYFDKKYNVNDDRKIDVGINILERHNEMQNVFYINSETSFYSEEYSFVWNFVGPYSPKLEVVLNNLDKKEDAIDNFYRESNSKRNMFFSNYFEQLKSVLCKYFHEKDSVKVAFSSYVFSNILERENGSKIISSVIYVYKNVYPKGEYQDVLEEVKLRLEKYNISVNEDVFYEVWRNLHILGIIEIESKKQSDEVQKLERKLD